MAEVTLSPCARTVKRFQEEVVWASGKFTVDTDGRVWRDGRRAEHHTGGYLQVKVMVAGVRHYTCAHRLVWRALVGPIPHGRVINHKNECKTDNRPANLEVVTYSDNTKHAYRVGLIDEHGERNPAAKLTDSQVATMRNMYAQGGYTMEDLAGQFGVRFQHVSRIIRGTRRARQLGPILTSDLRHTSSERKAAG